MIGNYIEESTENLIRRAEQTLGVVPVLDLRNWQSPTYTAAGGHIRSLGRSCHSITVKNVITVTDTSIVTCAAATGSCNAIPATCGDIGTTTPDLFYNFVATVNALVDQTGVEITFQAVIDGLPTSIPVTKDLSKGDNPVYAYPLGNQTYSSDTQVVLYGAEVTKY